MWEWLIIAVCFFIGIYTSMGNKSDNGEQPNSEEHFDT